MFQMCELGSWDVVCLGSRDPGLGAVVTELRLKSLRQVGGSQETAVSTGDPVAGTLGTSEQASSAQRQPYWRGASYRALRTCFPGWKCLSDNQWEHCQTMSNLVLLSGRRLG